MLKRRYYALSILSCFYIFSVTVICDFIPSLLQATSNSLISRESKNCHPLPLTQQTTPTADSSPADMVRHLWGRLYCMLSTRPSILLGSQSRMISILWVEFPSESDPAGSALCLQIHHRIWHHTAGQGPYAEGSLGAFLELQFPLGWSLCASGGTGWWSGRSAVLHLI